MRHDLGNRRLNKGASGELAGLGNNNHHTTTTTNNNNNDTNDNNNNDVWCDRPCRMWQGWVPRPDLVPEARLSPRVPRAAGYLSKPSWGNNGMAQVCLREVFCASGDVLPLKRRARPSPCQFRGPSVHGRAGQSRGQSKILNTASRSPVQIHSPRAWMGRARRITRRLSSRVPQAYIYIYIYIYIDLSIYTHTHDYTILHQTISTIIW